jgi:hypothetical protein
MAMDPNETRARLDRLLREANARVPERPIEPEAPVLRARRAIRIRYAVIGVSFVALTLVLTAGAVFARDRLDDPGPTGPTSTGATGPTATGPLPEVTITTVPDELTNDPQALFGFTIRPPATPRCTLNGDEVPCTNSAQVTAREGENTFRVVGIDDQGRRGEPASYTWTLDTIAPTVELTSVELVYAPTVDDVSCSVDQQPASCTDPIEGLTSGQHAFLVSLPYDWDLTWILSATPPTATFVGTGDTAAPETSTVRFSFEVEGSGTAECLAGDASTPCDQGVLVDSVTNTGTEPITRTLEIVPIDAAGNRGAPLQFTWSFDAVDTSVG